MNIYTEKDISIINKNIAPILKKADIQNRLLIEPTKTESDAVSQIVIDFVKRKKRKVYGGFALNILFKNKDLKKALYDEWKLPDIDFYSPEPLQDIYELCDLIHEAGFKNTQGSEAQHKGTYKIHVNYQDYSDISYLSNNIYHTTPFLTIDGFTVTHPLFLMIDYYRGFTDPLTSYSIRLEKTIPRFYQMQKYYPISRIEHKLNLQDTKDSVELKEFKKYILKFMLNKDTIIACGWYMYNYFLKESGLKHKYIYNINEIPHYEIISTNYKEDVLKLFEELKKKFPISANKFSIIEYYPFHNYLGYSTAINYNDKSIIVIYDYDGRCTPYKTIRINNRVDKLKISTFNFTLMMYIIMIFRARSNKLKQKELLYRTICSHLLIMRQHYYKINKNKTLFDDTAFQEFVVKCIGHMSGLFRLKRDRVQHNITTKKKYPFKYIPSEKKQLPQKYIFPNSSGNKIRKHQNLKVFKINNKE
jgi:hypothetical protein